VNRFAPDYLDHIADRLYSSVLADILDDAGHRHQVMRHDVRPLYPGAKAVGRAATMLAIEVTELPSEPYKLLMDLLDNLRPGEVVVGAVQGRPGGALWGELLSTHTRAKGGRGTVLDGLSRDSWGIVGMKFPVFATGRRHSGHDSGRRRLRGRRRPGVRRRRRLRGRARIRRGGCRGSGA